MTPQDREYDLSLGSGASPTKPEQAWTGPRGRSFFLRYSGISADVELPANRGSIVSAQVSTEMRTASILAEYQGIYLINAEYLAGEEPGRKALALAFR